MVRTQVYLDKKEYEFLRQEAFYKRSSISAILRDIIDGQLITKPKNEAAGLRKIVGIFKDKRTDVAKHHDDYLAGVKK